MVRIMLVGNVAPQTKTVFDYLLGEHRQWFASWVSDPKWLTRRAVDDQPDLIVVAGWRHLVPPEVLAIPRLGTVGFHSAKLPEYPGRAPIPWTLLRGDRHAYNTMFFLDEGVDSGDIITDRRHEITPDDTPETLYEWVARTDVEMLHAALPTLLLGIAPRYRQDPARRGPLTSADGWQLYRQREYSHG